jgi:D-beta-D-heptose 7-phosphate kinase / D-beta-D-heptose 1-phosphate adenosyltransferase
VTAPIRIQDIVTTPKDIMEAWRDLKTLVIGDVILDAFMQGVSTRRAPEAPGCPVVDLDRLTAFEPGGAANVAANVRSLGGRVMLIGVRGDDPTGDLLEEIVTDRGIDCKTPAEPGRVSLGKARVISNGLQIARIDAGCTDAICPNAEELICLLIRQAWRNVHAVIISDYGKGTMTPRVIAEIARLRDADCRTTEEKTLVIDAVDLKKYRSCMPTAVVPNRRQASRLLSLHEDGRTYTSATNASIVARTLDALGVSVSLANGETFTVAARKVSPSFPSGAGDTFTAALALALGSQIGSVKQAVELAQRAAEIAVSRVYTASVRYDELLNALEEPAKVNEPSKPTKPVKASKPSKPSKPRLVLACGCFDVLHPGHLRLLEAARSIGDRLVVGINSDDSVRRLKGPTRPINSVEKREAMLRALKVVDDVVVFEEDTPCELIDKLAPTYYVKGGDYGASLLVESNIVKGCGGVVVIVPLVPGHSTTSILDRINGRQRAEV